MKEKLNMITGPDGYESVNRPLVLVFWFISRAGGLVNRENVGLGWQGRKDNNNDPAFRQCDRIYPLVYTDSEL